MEIIELIPFLTAKSLSLANNFFIPFGVYRTLQSQIGRNEFESAEKGINGLKRRIQYAVEENAIEYDEY